MEDKGNGIPSVTVKSITFNNDTKIAFASDDIVLLVGANNVGKSRILKDLKDDLNGTETTRSKILIKNVEYLATNFSDSQLKNYFERNVAKDSYGNYTLFTDDNGVCTYDKGSFSSSQDKPFFYKALFSFLSTENRLEITRPIMFNTSVNNRSLSVMKKLEIDKNTISIINQVLDLGFQKEIEVYEEYLDNTIMKGYKIGKHADILAAQRLNKRDYLTKMEKMEDLHNQGDGIRSAVAILSLLNVSEHSLYLIDEPETFLHPPQAKLLGKELVRIANQKQCFISTHNIDFIKGVIEGGPTRVKVIKIDREDSNNEFNLVENSVITDIANDKNLKYTNILDGLFYDRLVICENESDCKFYSAILEYLDLNLYQNTLFCAVGGKDQFKKVLPLLNKLSIRYSVIADIDLINNVDNVKQLLNSIEIGSYNKIEHKHKEFIEMFNQNIEPEVKTQSTLKNEINNVFTDEMYMSEKSAQQIKSLLKNASGLKILKSRGKRAIPSDICKSRFDEIVGYLRDKNVYVLECGEIESLIPDVGGHGNTWVEKTFDKYKDMESEVYNEAKQFMRQVFGLI